MKSTRLIVKARVLPGELSFQKTADLPHVAPHWTLYRHLNSIGLIGSNEINTIDCKGSSSPGGTFISKDRRFTARSAALDPLPSPSSCQGELGNRTHNLVVCITKVVAKQSCSPDTTTSGTVHTTELLWITTKGSHETKFKDTSSHGISDEVPDVCIPDLCVPQDEIPDLCVPQDEIPDLCIPQDEIPDLCVPQDEVPDVCIPDLCVPLDEIPDFVHEISCGQTDRQK
ncbi:hypothetical protein J6590_091769 [Homalodisca vitripennis]|nr:hypothetical protein J6590_091769 [Homalodisca vitripennis]